MGATGFAAFLVSVGLYVVAAQRYGGDADDTGRSITMAVAGTLLSGLAIAVVVGWLARRVDKATSERQFRRSLARETLDAHATVKAAAIRTTTYRSVKAYNEAVRDLAIPARARLGGVASEIQGDPALKDDADLNRSIRNCLAFLDELVDEFSVGYLTASRLQEVAERSRKVALPNSVSSDDLKTILDPGRSQEELRKEFGWLGANNPAWSYLMSERFPKLLVLQSHSVDGGDYETVFSKHIQTVLHRLEQVPLDW